MVVAHTKGKAIEDLVVKMAMRRQVERWGGDVQDCSEYFTEGEGMIDIETFGELIYGKWDSEDLSGS